MAQTDLRKYGTEERLGKMDLDLIDVEVPLDDGVAYGDGDVLFIVKEIPYAVSVPGGTGLIHSIAAIISSTGGEETGNIDIVITSDETVLGVNANTALNGNTIDLTGFCGIASITNIIDAGANISFGNATNIGMVAKANSGSTSLYCYGIARSTNTYTTGSNDPKITLRFGIVKD